MLPPNPFPVSRQRGAALMLVALILLIGGLSFFFSRFSDNPSVSRDTFSQSSLEQARQALIGYAATYRDSHAGEMFGYLPCPDTNNDGNAEAGCANAGEVVIGRLPYRTLGMPSLHDSSGECLWYAVGNFKNNPKNDTLVPAEAMNWDTTGHFIVRDLDNQILAAPQQTDGGAAALIFAPGPPLAGQARAASIAGNPCSGDATNTAAVIAAYLDGGYATPAATALSATYVVTAGRANSAVNNDRVAWVTPGEILSRRVKLRQDFQSGINAMLSGVQACLQSAFVAPTPIDTVPPSNANAGRVPNACADTLPSGNYDANYRDNLFYARCPVAGSRCMTVNGATCDGVLLFSGERASGQSRVTDTDKRTIANYLEGANAVPFAPGGGSPAGSIFAGNGTFGAAQATPTASTDVALCLVQNLSFASDIGRLETTSPTVAGRQFASVNTVARTLTLGDATTTAAPGTLGSESLYGCSWFPDSRLFGNGARIYFTADFQQIGEGITFVLADAATNPDTFRCGAAGQSLGYSGQGAGAGNPIRPPKIGLEFDTRANVGYDESLTEPLAGRMDDALLLNNPHAAFVYWGNSLANPAQSVAQPTWDDNVHGKGGSLSATGRLVPTNPTAGGKHKKMRGAGAGGIDKYVVRLDIKRTRDTTDPANKKSVYVLQGWVFALNGEACYATAVGAGIADLSDDFENFIFWSACGTPFTDTITIYDEDSSEAFKSFRVGFSTGQSSTGQRVVLSDFALGARP